MVPKGLASLLTSAVVVSPLWKEVGGLGTGGGGGRVSSRGRVRAYRSVGCFPAVGRVGTCDLGRTVRHTHVASPRMNGDSLVRTRYGEIRLTVVRDSIT